eukprot:2501845-Pleurochrysis_carterae.AAC.2
MTRTSLAGELAFSRVVGSLLCALARRGHPELSQLLPRSNIQLLFRKSSPFNRRVALIYSRVHFSVVVNATAQDVSFAHEILRARSMYSKIKRARQKVGTSA